MGKERGRDILEKLLGEEVEFTVRSGSGSTISNNVLIRINEKGKKNKNKQ